MIFKYTWPVLVWALVILILCAIPGRDLPHSDWLEALSFDKWVHAGVFFVLEIFLIRAFLFSRFERLQNNARIATVPISIVYGGALELMQEAVFSERSADILDFIANSFGVIVGAAVYSMLARKFSKFLMPDA